MSGLIIEKMLSVDDTGMPKMPSIRQLQDKDVLELYARDKTPNKSKYIQEVGVIYYLGDPKSPAMQQGLSEDEALKMAIDNYNLPINYEPDVLVYRLIGKYYNENITQAGVAVEILQKSIHLISQAALKINELLDKKLRDGMNADEINNTLQLMDSVNKRIVEIPILTKSLAAAYENLRTEEETQIGRGNQQILSSMKADDGL